METIGIISSNFQIFLHNLKILYKVKISIFGMRRAIGGPNEKKPGGGDLPGQAIGRSFLG
jgi:hypothetical protein